MTPDPQPTAAQPQPFEGKPIPRDDGRNWKPSRPASGLSRSEELARLRRLAKRAR
jgi:hypothetical protein